MQHGYRKAHARIWLILGILLPVLIVWGIVLRQNGPLERAGVPLDDTAKAVLNQNGAAR